MLIPEDPVFNIWSHLSFFNLLILGLKSRFCTEINSHYRNAFCKNFSELFSQILWDLIPGIKAKNIINYSNIHNSPLLPLLNPKNTNFSPLVFVNESPKEIKEKVLFGNIFRLLKPHF
jgi:hypothetical protein